MSAPRIAAHVILGPREEPFLGALLASIEESVGMLIVNDNGPDPSPHARTLEESRFGKHGCLAVDRTPFEGFAHARNVCLRIHAELDAGDWVAFVDADEVHGPAFHRIAAHLGQLPADVDFVDAYTWHFFQSFVWYTSIERRMMFFRYSPMLHWEGSVHERLQGASGRRIALPYVYGHYGHTLQPRRHAEKGRHYSSLGAPGEILREEQLDDFDVAEYFKPVYPDLLRFSGEHPRAAQDTLERLRPLLARDHELTERIAVHRRVWLRVRNAVRKLNYELRWRGRSIDPLARSMLNP